MAKLLPPYIDGSLPAQMGDGLGIPFRVNKAVSIKQVYKMYARIKTVATDKWLATLETENFSASETDGTYVASFDLTNLTLTPGQCYKVQLAFGNEIQGYFSSIGVFKYTTKPNVYIEDLVDYQTGNLYTYTGVYDQSGGDITEKVYNYRFDVYKGSILIASSGLCIHNHKDDTDPARTSDTWVLNQQLQSGITYQIRYTVYTVNGLTCMCQYNILNNEIDDDSLNDAYYIETVNDFDNGCVKVYLRSDKPTSLNGGFIVSRASDKDNYETWYDVMKFTLLDKAALPDTLWLDYTVEQGVKYKYGLQRFNDAGFYSSRIVNETPVLADFEDTFLFDGERQLKIRFNSKVTSFKNTVMETKLDTLGGKYPFIFRNGDVKYKEFPISGLISHLSDLDELFMSNLELGFQEESAVRTGTPHTDELKSTTRGTQVDTYNIVAERKFKLKVLDWLTNGQPKLFRSPGEGNYIIRLMNTSLTPNDTLNRMIHTFQSTAYEMAEFTFENLVKFGFIEDKTIDNRVLAITSAPVNHFYDNLLKDYKDGVYWAEFRQCVPGSIYVLQFLDGNGPVEISIPYNGFYHVNIYDNPLMSVTVKSLPPGYSKLTGYIDVGFYSQGTIGDFSQIRKISIKDESFYQIGSTDYNIVDYITNIKYKIGNIYLLRVETRPNKTVYMLDDGKIYFDKLKRNPIVYYPHYLYKVIKDNKLLYWIDGNDPSKTFSAPNYGLTFQIGETGTKEFIDLNPYPEDRGGLYCISQIEDLQYLKLGNGLFLDMYFQQKEYIYGIEEDDPDVARYKKNWQDNPTRVNLNRFLIFLETKLKEVSDYVDD